MAELAGLGFAVFLVHFIELEIVSHYFLCSVLVLVGHGPIDIHAKNPMKNKPTKVTK